jgi:hypothetical protein
MSEADKRTRIAGAWLAVSSVILALVFVFHGPISPDFGGQMKSIADGSLRWSVVHWAASAALSFFAVASLIVLTANSRLTDSWWTISAWAVLPIGALWTASTAVAEATVIFQAAVAGNREVYEPWWMYAEGRANGFAGMALAFTAIALNETFVVCPATPHWAAWIAAAAGTLSFAGWVMGSWLGLAFGAPIWVLGSLVMSLWLAWFGVSLARVEAGRTSARRDATSTA